MLCRWQSPEKAAGIKMDHASWSIYQTDQLWEWTESSRYMNFTNKINIIALWPVQDNVLDRKTEVQCFNSLIFFLCVVMAQTSVI